MKESAIQRVAGMHPGISWYGRNLRKCDETSKASIQNEIPFLEWALPKSKGLQSTCQNSYNYEKRGC